MASVEDSSMGWFLEMEADDDYYTLGKHVHMHENSFEDFTTHNSFITYQDDNNNNNIHKNQLERSESPESYTSGYSSIFISNTKTTTTTTTNNGNKKRSATTISFASGYQEGDYTQFDQERAVKQQKVDNNRKFCSNFSHVKGEKTALSQDHIMAERKRREKLNQRFIALSAILPGLKKSDKASVLEEAIRYVKELRENMKHLEHLTSNAKPKKTVVKKNAVSSSDDKNSSNNSSDDETSGPEIKIRFSEKNVLIRIHSQERTTLSLSNILREIESVQLTILNSSVMPFGKSATDITVIAEIEEGFSMTANDVVKHLQCVIS